MKHHCKDGKWWDLKKMKDDRYCIAVGKNKECLAIEFFESIRDAYKQKNKWLTRFNIRC
jgi:hypothetical protein